MNDSFKNSSIHFFVNCFVNCLINFVRQFLRELIILLDFVSVICISISKNHQLHWMFKLSFSSKKKLRLFISIFFKNFIRSLFDNSFLEFLRSLFRNLAGINFWIPLPYNSFGRFSDRFSDKSFENCWRKFQRKLRKKPQQIFKWHDSYRNFKTDGRRRKNFRQSTFNLQIRRRSFKMESPKKIPRKTRRNVRKLSKNLQRNCQ